MTSIIMLNPSSSFQYKMLQTQSFLNNHLGELLNVGLTPGHGKVAVFAGSINALLVECDQVRNLWQRIHMLVFSAGCLYFFKFWSFQSIKVGYLRKRNEFWGKLSERKIKRLCRNQTHQQNLMIKLDKMLVQIFLRFKLVSYVRWCQTNLNRLISDKNVSWNCQRITI